MPLSTIALPSCMQGPTCELPEHRLSPIEMWNGNKRLQTLVADVAPDTITIRSLDWVRATAALWLLWIDSNDVLAGEMESCTPRTRHTFVPTSPLPAGPRPV